MFLVRINTLSQIVVGVISADEAVARPEPRGEEVVVLAINVEVGGIAVQAANEVGGIPAVS